MSWHLTQTNPLTDGKTLIHLVKRGIFVTGGSNGYYFINSVEFYDWSLSTWQNLDCMKAARLYHILLFVNNTLLAVRSYKFNMLSLIEELQDNKWIPSSNLKTARAGHESVSIPVGMISRWWEQNFYINRKVFNLPLYWSDIMS